MSNLRKYNALGDVASPQNDEYPGFLVLGTGLPRTGTMSLRGALGKLLGGKVYHGTEVRLKRLM